VETNSSQKFDIIFMDINYEENDLGMSPPFKFVEESFLSKLLGMTSKEGFLAFNLLCYDKETLDKVFKEVKNAKAESSVYVSGDEDLNKVVILSKSKIGTVEERL
jgi:hypothetical protein